MSAQVIRNFFPILLKQAESSSLVAPLINAIFPKHIQQLCPVPAIHLQNLPRRFPFLRPLIILSQILQENFELKWPTVAAACITGGSLSLLSGGHMLCRSASKKGFFTWGFALFWYGVMCLGGLFYHCIKPSLVFRNVDVIATACSSISVVAGSILADDTVLTQRLLLLAVYVSVAVAAVCGPEVVQELLYLGPTAVAFVAGAWFMWKTVIREKRVKVKVKRCKEKAAQWWCVVGAGGAAVGVGSVVCDKWLCLLWGSNFMFSFFVGCNVAVFALCQMVIALESSGSKVKHS